MLKRVKVTGTGKITKRRNHQNHFNAKESGNQTRGKKGMKAVPTGLVKKIQALMPNA
jgi:ribosomal protein L35